MLGCVRCGCAVTSAGLPGVTCPVRGHPRGVPAEDGAGPGRWAGPPAGGRSCAEPPHASPEGPVLPQRPRGSRRTARPASPRSAGECPPALPNKFLRGAAALRALRDGLSALCPPSPSRRRCPRCDCPRVGRARRGAGWPGRERPLRRVPVPGAGRCPQGAQFSAPRGAPGLPVRYCAPKASGDSPLGWRWMQV